MNYAPPVVLPTQLTQKQIDKELSKIYNIIKKQEKTKVKVRGRSLRDVICLVCEWRRLCNGTMGKKKNGTMVKVMLTL